MNAAERRERILDYISKYRNANVEEIAAHFKIAVPTIYKDLKILVKNNQIEKTHGRIAVAKPEECFFQFNKRIDENEKIKRVLAVEAIKNINNGETIAIDSSTTAFHIIKMLPSSSIDNLTIVTNSIMILRENSIINNHNFNIIITGGFFERKNVSCVGIGDIVNENLLINIKIDKFFFSCYGLSVESGIMDAFQPQLVKVKGYFFQKSLKQICVVSSDKFEINGTLNWISFDKLKTIITDENIKPETKNLLNEKGVDVIIARK